jgi:hypothetical protein
VPQIVHLPDRLQTALTQYSEKTTAICDSLAEAVEGVPTPKTIYHYTDDRGLKGILSTGRLWFTDLFELNDPSELEHGLLRGLQILNIRTNDGPPEAKKFAQKCCRALSGNIKSVAHYFICCFSKIGDDLGQWRAYAEDGHGYAIDFDVNLLEKAFEQQKIEGGENSTFPVSYDDRKMSDMHKRLVEATIPVVSKPREMDLDDGIIHAFMQSLSEKLALHFYEVSMYFKNEAYRSEQEYRFLQTFSINQPIPNLLFRSRPYSLVRYREFDWKSMHPHSISEIVCGPASGRKQVKFVHDCLREDLPAAEVNIKRSAIPYRSAYT